MGVHELGAKVGEKLDAEGVDYSHNVVGAGVMGYADESRGVMYFETKHGWVEVTPSGYLTAEFSGIGDTEQKLFKAISDVTGTGA